jgi:hypothetical protein
MLSREQRTVRKRFDTLIAAPVHRFPKLGERLDAPKKPGVYAIYDPQKRVVHVGTTPRAKNGIYQRLGNHLRVWGPSSFTRSYLKGNGPKLREGYTYRCLPVKNPRRRALLEAYAIGCLCPKHLGDGQLRKAEIAELD